MASKTKTQPALRAENLPEIKPGKYGDGMPLDELPLPRCKLILAQPLYRRVLALFDFAKVTRRPAKQTGVRFDPADYELEPLQIRGFCSVDTHDCRRTTTPSSCAGCIPYKDGFPVGDPEIVFSAPSSRSAEGGRDGRDHVNTTTTASSS